MSEWREVALDQFIKIKHGFAFSGDGITDEDTGKRLVTPGNFHIGGGFKDTKFKYFRNAHPEEYEFSGGEIVVTMTDLSKETDALGYAAKIPIDTENIYLHNQRVGLVQFISNEVYQDFIYWLMRTYDYHWFIVGSASGTSIMHTSPSRIGEYVFLLPPLLEQRAIVAVLSSLDDKIDLLHRQNKTLEAMAETLFRQWFVEEADDEWEEGTLGDIVTVLSGTTPKTENSNYWNGEYHWTSPRDITNLNGLFLFDTERKITKLGLDQISSGLLPCGSLLMSSRAPVGALAFAEIPVAINQGYAGVVCDKGFSREFVYLWLKENMGLVQAHANGSTFQEISKSTFRELDITIPDKKTLMEFQAIIFPSFSKMKTNSLQVRTLEKLRDTLLPKLMSGEVRVEV
jgi:type I restriction enzyme S subunit